MNVLKKTALSISFVASMCIAPNLNATDTTSNYSTAVEIARSQAVLALVDKINALEEQVKYYVYATGDITPTIPEVNAFSGLTTTAWENYDGGVITLNLTSKDLIFGNLFTNDPSDTTKSTFETSDNLPPLSVISQDYKTITIPLPADFAMFYELTTKIQSDPNAIISQTPPANTALVWYYPNKRGGYNVSIFNTESGQWEGIGDTNQNIIVTSKDDLDKLSVTAGTIGLVSDGEYATEYVFDGAKWILKSVAGTGAGGLFDGTATIHDMATTIFDKAGGSKAMASAPFGEFDGSLTFTKKDDSETGGFWITEDGKYVVTKNIEKLSKLSHLFATDTIAWIDDGKDSVYSLQKKILPNGTTYWVYVAKDYSDLLHLDEAQNSGYDGQYFYVTSHNEFFYFESNQFKPVNGITFVSKYETGRNVFSPTSGKRYLIQSNDCSDTTCNGDSTTGYYAGSKTDGLFTFYYATTGKRKNNLIDATPYTSWNAFWDNEVSAVQWMGGNFGNVPTGAILLKTTLNGKIAYDYNGKLVNKANGYYIPYNVLPYGMYADSAKIASGYVIVDELDDFVTDTHLPVNYPVNLTGSGFTRLNIKQCTKVSDDPYWSDKCSSPAYAQMVVTNGSRSDLPAPISLTRVNLTKQLGSERRYTSNGITYPKDSGYKQWFYATTGYITNKMLDAPVCNSGESCYANNTIVVLHSPRGILYKRSNGYYQDTNGYYLSKHKNYFEKDIRNFGTWSAGANMYYTGCYYYTPYYTAVRNCSNKGSGWIIPASYEIGYSKIQHCAGGYTYNWLRDRFSGSPDNKIFDEHYHVYDAWTNDKKYNYRCVR